MNPEILKLAEKHCYGKSFHFADQSLKEIAFMPEGLETFYKAAYNAGLEAALNKAYEMKLLSSDGQCADAIRKLKVKP